MKTLISSSKAPLFQPIPKSSSPWNHKPAQTLALPIKATSSSSQRPTTTQRPNARGFSGVDAKAEAPAAINKPSSSAVEDGGEIPQVVFERMMVRIAVSVGVPMAAGLASMKFFGAVKNQWDIPIWVQIVTLLCTFGVSTVGLAYGALSSSWDAENKGSFLGVEELKKNWVDMWREEDESNNRNN